MSESDGLQRLTAYLNQTRRQAEAAVDALNVEISRLQQENDAYEAICRELEEEKEQYRNQVEQLKQEGTTKHRLQERDDWRSLIDSVQKDRSRLQEECNTLETALEMAREEITTLQEELEKQNSEQKEAGIFCDGAESFSRTSSPGMRSQRGSMTVVGTNSDDMSGHAILSPILDRNGNELNINFTETPRNIVGQLKLELKKAYSQVLTPQSHSLKLNLISVSFCLRIFLVDSGAPAGRSITVGASLGDISSARRTRLGAPASQPSHGLWERVSERACWQWCRHGAEQ